jgi:hypothetical protein
LTSPSDSELSPEQAAIEFDRILGILKNLNLAESQDDGPHERWRLTDEGQAMWQVMTRMVSPYIISGMLADMLTEEWVARHAARP